MGRAESTQGRENNEPKGPIQQCAGGCVQRVRRPVWLKGKWEGPRVATNNSKQLHSSYYVSDTIPGTLHIVTNLIIIKIRK